MIMISVFLQSKASEISYFAFRRRKKPLGLNTTKLCLLLLAAPGLWMCMESHTLP